MQAMRLSDPEGVIAGLLGEPHEGLRRAAVGYLLARSPDPTAFARRLLDGDDPALRQYTLDALFDRPSDAPDAVTPQWIDARLKSGSREDLLLAARAAGVMTGRARVERLRTLLDPSGRRRSARRPALRDAPAEPASSSTCCCRSSWCPS